MLLNMQLKSYEVRGTGARYEVRSSAMPSARHARGRQHDGQVHQARTTERDTKPNVVTDGPTEHVVTEKGTKSKSKASYAALLETS